MSDQQPTEEGQWGYFILVLLLLPILPFLFVFAAIGGGSVKLLLDKFDPSGKHSDNHPSAYLFLYFTIVGLAIFGGFFLMLNS